MKARFKGWRISTVLSVVPTRTAVFAEEVSTYGFNPGKTLQLGKVLGLDERRLAWEGECTSDYFFYGVDYLFKTGKLSAPEIGAIISVTQTPDQLIPSTSALLHGRLGLGMETLCLDANQGCCGFIHGLLQALLVSSVPGMGKILLLCGDTLSRVCCPMDRNIYPLIGDAGSVTILEPDEDGEDIFLSLRTDGKRAHWLEIPAGGFRRPSTEETRLVVEFPDGNRRSQEHFHMNGSGVFLFTQTDVPKMIEDLLDFSGDALGHIDGYIFHQPNRFLLEKLASRLGVESPRMPADVVGKFGNSSSATIPLAICQSFAERVKMEALRVCLAGFGVGLSWGGAVLNLGPLDCCELLEKPKGVVSWEGATGHAS